MEKYKCTVNSFTHLNIKYLLCVKHSARHEDKRANKIDMVSVLRVSQKGEAEPKTSKSMKVLVIKTTKETKAGQS